MYDLIIQDATIVSSQGRQVADIAVEDGKIAYVGSRPAGRAHETISAIGKFIMPGVIDTHVHFRDPGHNHKETWETGSRAAISGGVTTVLDMPNTRPTTTDIAALKDKRERASANSRSNFGIWAGATANNTDDLNKMVDAGAVGIKIFMGSSTGPLLVPPDAMESIFTKTRGLIGCHAEDESILRELHSQHADNPSPKHHEVRPPAAALAAVEQLIGLVEAHNRHVHICHLSTADEMHLLTPVKNRLPITVEACPHHLFLSAETTEALGNLSKCNPPVRPELDRKAMWTAINRGRIDTLGSDHAPHTLEEKAAEYWNAPAGLPGVETSLPLLLSAVKFGKLALERMVDLMSERPAALFGLTNKGSILEGKDADLVLFREGEVAKLKDSDLLTMVGWSPFVGRDVGVKPELVVVNGRIVSRSGTIVDDESRGLEVAHTNGQ